ncbi:RNA-binding protein [Candidatus Bathyarchaeota archaeon]|nr:RNA-binding protein [Candidatus Bathyarchaeota archaeon]
MDEERHAPLRRSRPLSIAIPASIVDDVYHMRDKTLIVGWIGRAASIFRVDEVIIYRDRPSKEQREVSEVIADILTYMETPQYLRRRLIPMKPSLRYAGVLPPLRTPHHPTKRRFVDLRPGEFREGIVVSSSDKRSLVDIGVERPAHIPGVKLPVKSRVTVQVIKLGKRIHGRIVDREDVKYYWGYKVIDFDGTLKALLQERRRKLIIATSRYGRDVSEVWNKLKEEAERFDGILVLFGAPTAGLYEIAERENVKLDEEAHFILNFFRSQGTETVRTEEAVLGVLSILNLLLE